jgi:uncharacterized membrane protein
MLKAKYPAFVFFVIVIFAIALLIFYYPQLPERIASHFNFRGEADGWMSKNSVLIFDLATTLFISVLFGLLAIFIPRMPKSYISMPNKDYWLNDDNIEETRKLVQRFLFWFGSFTIGFITLTFYETIQTNLEGSNKLDSNFWIYFAAYLVITLFYTVWLVLHFRNNNIPNQTEIK